MAAKNGKRGLKACLPCMAHSLFLIPPFSAWIGLWQAVRVEVNR